MSYQYMFRIEVQHGIILRCVNMFPTLGLQMVLLEDPLLQNETSIGNLYFLVQVTHQMALFHNQIVVVFFLNQRHCSAKCAQKALKT